MSRSRHDGCGKTCGLCQPHKKWKSNSLEDQRAGVRRALQDDDDRHATSGPEAETGSGDQDDPVIDPG